jgi:dTDP-4-amino-4,6-dideoxygalactose transaminase
MTDVSNPHSQPVQTAIPVPMLDFCRQYKDIREEVLDAITRVCDSQRFILGPAVSSFEQAAARACATPNTPLHAIGCASGTDALWLALTAAGIGSLDGTRPSQHAVITSPFSFFASVSAILRAGAHPLLADIDPLTFNLSPTAVETVLNSEAGASTKAILPIHLYGQCADMDALATLQHRHPGLLIFEDAAQAFGATWRTPSGEIKPAGSLGTAAAFSFYPTKNLSAFGDAGLVTTTSAAIDQHARSIRAHGMTRRYYHDEIGWNSRLDEIQAAVLEVKLRHLPRWNQQRRTLAARYDHLFQSARLAPKQNPGGPSFPASSERVGCLPIPATTPTPKPSTTADGIILPYTDPRATHIYHQYVIRAPRRDALRQYLTGRQIGSEIYYPVPLHLQTSLAHLGYKAGDFPESERAATEVLALPIYPELREDEQQAVVEAIRAFYA